MKLQLKDNDGTWRYLRGNYTAAKVKADGYGFTLDPEAGWTFPTEKAARAKGVIVARHMGWPGEIIVERNWTAFADTHAAFQADLADLAVDINLALLEVWQQWKHYRDAMEMAGQSAVVMEFRKVMERRAAV
jgi:hypothetical protein